MFVPHAPQQSGASQQAPAAPAAPPVPVLPARPGAATGATGAAGTGAATGPEAANLPVNLTGDPVRNAANATLDGATATRNAFREMREEIRNGLRDGFEGAQGTEGTQGVVIQPPPLPPYESPIPPEVVPIVSIVFGSIVIMTLFAPIIRAIIRAFERRADKAVVPAVKVAEQLHTLQSSLDTMAIEVERISEAQRFQAKLLAERAERAGLTAGREEPR